MKRIFRKYHSILRDTALLARETEKSLINQGRILTRLQEGAHYDDLRHYEFSIFSQWGEDGIIQYLVGRIPEISRTFIEFGVETFVESNCRFLMMKDNWSGFIIDGSQKNVDTIKSKRWYWMHNLNAIDAFIDKDNISDLLELSGFGLEPGILSLDIDGVDYYVLDALKDWRPHIVIVEYNGLWGVDRPVTVPYDSSFQRTNKHFSNVYWGANLKAFDDLLNERGFFLAGTNSVGSNAFYVRNDYSDRFARADLHASCRPVTFREARDEQGHLSMLSQRQRVDIISHLPLVDVSTGETIRVADLGLGTVAQVS